MKIAELLKNLDYDDIRIGVRPHFTHRMVELVRGKKIEYPAIMTKNTIPGEDPFRITWFDKNHDGSWHIAGHVQLDNPFQQTTEDGWVYPLKGVKITSDGPVGFGVFNRKTPLAKE